MRSVPAALGLEVLDDLVGAGPLGRRDDEVDVTSAEAVERMVGDTARIDPKSAKLVTPGDRGVLVLEAADGLPTREARIVDGDQRLLRYVVFAESSEWHGGEAYAPPPSRQHSERSRG